MSTRNEDISISFEYAPDEERQIRAILTILGLSPEEIERMIEAEEIDDKGLEA